MHIQMLIYESTKKNDTKCKKNLFLFNFFLLKKTIAHKSTLKGNKVILFT